MQFRFRVYPMMMQEPQVAINYCIGGVVCRPLAQEPVIVARQKNANIGGKCAGEAIGYFDARTKST
jgi:hypothetical protein